VRGELAHRSGPGRTKVRPWRVHRDVLAAVAGRPQPRDLPRLGILQASAPRAADAFVFSAQAAAPLPGVGFTPVPENGQAASQLHYRTLIGRNRRSLAW
jgi:hypothetical protein